MSDQYLWNKSGAPDAETEGLERSLGSLRYRPSEKSKARILEATREATRDALSLAAETTAAPRRTRRFAPAYAIAATLLLAIVTGSLWIKMHTPQSIKTVETPLAATTTILPPEHLLREDVSNNRSHYPAVNFPASTATTLKDLPNSAQTFVSSRKYSHKKQSAAAFERRLISAPNRVTNSLRSGKDNDTFSAEGERAKEQLVRALYIASEKLNFAQKKIQVNKDNVPAS